MTKPEIIPHTGTWMCSGSGVARKGRSPAVAYRNWLLGVEAKAVKDAEQEVVTLKVAKIETREPYQGVVVPVRAPRDFKPITLPTDLRIAAARAAKSQPAISGMTSTVKGYVEGSSRRGSV